MNPLKNCSSKGGVWGVSVRWASRASPPQTAHMEPTDF